MHQDESTFYANADQAFFWSDGSSSVLKQKSLGQSIMVSDFVEEKSNYFLQNGGMKARLCLETQRKLDCVLKLKVKDILIAPSF